MVSWQSRDCGNSEKNVYGSTDLHSVMLSTSVIEEPFIHVMEKRELCPEKCGKKEKTFSERTNDIESIPYWSRLSLQTALVGGTPTLIANLANHAIAQQLCSLVSTP